MLSKGPPIFEMCLDLAQPFDMCGLQDEAAAAAAAAAASASPALTLDTIAFSSEESAQTSSSALQTSAPVLTIADGRLTTSPAGTSTFILPGRKHAGPNRKNGHLTTRAERAQRKAEKEKLRQVKAEEAAAQAQAEAKLAKQLAVTIYVRCEEEVCGSLSDILAPGWDS
jgi:hypothetical protein